MSKKPTEVAAPVVVHQHKALGTALDGTITEKVEAFAKMANALASLQLNGWDNVQKVVAGCWLADGAGMHPGVFMQNHYVMFVKGRLIIEPKYEFILGVLQSRVPGFKFEVLREDNDGASVRMSDGTNTHLVTYTTADAKRQGLMGRDNAWSSGNTREMCLKQAIKRCGRRIGAAALMDLPIGFDTMEVEDPALQDGDEPGDDSGATVVEPAGDGGSVEGAATSPTAQASPPAISAHDALRATVVALYGEQTKAVLLEKVSFLYNKMVEEQHGPGRPKVTFTKAKDISEAVADGIVKWLAERGNFVVEEPPPAEEEAPPAEAPVAKHATINEDYDAFMELVAKARKTFPRKFVSEAPPESGKYWFIDQATFSQVGLSASIKLMDQGAISIPHQTLLALKKQLQADVDAAQRGRP